MTSTVDYYQLLNEVEYDVKNYPRIMQIEAKSPRPKKRIDILLFLLHHHHSHSDVLPFAICLLSSCAISSLNSV